MNPPPASRRVASLLPAATEIIAALGAEELLVGVSHECDYPPSIARLPRLTGSPIDTSGTSTAIDTQVRTLHTAGRPVITVDPLILHQVRPDLILTQGLCEVCAVVEGDVRSLAQILSPLPAVLPLAARTMPGIFADIEAIAGAIGRGAEGRELVTSLQQRLRSIGHHAAGRVPRVLVVEWVEPLYLAGHWVPELVGSAGGKDVGAAPGDHSHPRSWREVTTLAPDVIVVALCGFGLARAVEEWNAFLAGGTAEASIARGLDVPVWAIDGNAYTSRPGPRIVEGAWLIRQALLGTGTAGVVRLG